MGKVIFAGMFVAAVCLMAAGVLQKSGQDFALPPLYTAPEAQHAQPPAPPPLPPLIPERPEEENSCDYLRAEEAFDEGTLCYENKDFECAHKKFADALAFCPTHSDAQLGLAEVNITLSPLE